MSRRRRKKLPSEVVELEITGLSHEGRGIAKRDGKTVFVDGALAGEKVLAKLTRTSRKFDEAQAEQLLQVSPDRVEPQCPHAAICGGCSLQHLDSEKQIQFKQSTLLEQYQHFGAIQQVALNAPLTGPVWGYRRKARLGVKYVEKKGGVLVGFREKRSSFLADIEQCKVLDPRVGQLIMPLRECIGGLSIRSAIPQIEVAAGEQAVVLVFRMLQSPSASDKEALLNFGRQHGVHIYSQLGGPDTVVPLDEDQEKIDLYYFLPQEDLKIHFQPLDFTQVNAQINERMVTLALNMLALDTQERVLDLFCGLGNFTLALARYCSEVVGVEGSAELVTRSRENAALNNISNVEFYAADLTQEISTQPWYGEGFDKILIDPPRSGAENVIRHIAELGVKRVVYVSCNPATLARDAGLLVGSGYRLVESGVMDMFPHTAHVESIALFEKT